MDDLRWALLVVGVVFLAGLAWWELRKPRHAARDGDAEGLPPVSRSTADLDLPPAVRRVEPHFGEPPVVREIPDDVPTVHPREPDAAPPVVLVHDLQPVDDAQGIVVTSDVAIDTPLPRGRSIDLDEPDGQPAGPDLADEETSLPVAAGHPEPTALVMPPAPAAPSAGAAPDSPSPRPPPEPEWPPEAERRILSVRVVPRPPNRFPGRSMRQAFQACGLDYGAMDIFHLEDENGQVFASAANLMRPGSFNLDTMDGSHFHGVNLFCVLPGPLSPERTVDELIALARDLGQRLGGMVLDDVGQPLDEQGAARLRASVSQAPQG